jgi:hypothetical protein
MLKWVLTKWSRRVWTGADLAQDGATSGELLGPCIDLTKRGVP